MMSLTCSLLAKEVEILSDLRMVILTKEIEGIAHDFVVNPSHNTSIYNSYEKIPYRSKYLFTVS